MPSIVGNGKDSLRQECCLNSILYLLPLVIIFYLCAEITVGRQMFIGGSKRYAPCSQRAGQSFMFAFSTLSQLHECAVGTIGTPPRGLYKLVHLPFATEALVLTSHSCPWPTESLPLIPSDVCLAVFFCSIPLFSFSSNGPHSGASWWRVEVVCSSGLNGNVLSKGIWVGKVFRESVFRSLDSVGSFSCNSFLKSLPEFTVVLLPINKPKSRSLTTPSLTHGLWVWKPLELSIKGGFLEILMVFQNNP